MGCGHAVAFAHHPYFVTSVRMPVLGRKGVCQRSLGQSWESNAHSSDTTPCALTCCTVLPTSCCLGSQALSKPCLAPCSSGTSPSHGPHPLSPAQPRASKQKAVPAVAGRPGSQILGSSGWSRKNFREFPDNLMPLLELLEDSRAFF